MAVEADSFDCRKCQQRFCDEAGELWAPGPDDKPGKRELLQSWGKVRERGGIPFQPWEILGEVHYSCPLPKRPRWWEQAWGMVLAWEKGVMLDPGGWRDQPAWYSELMPRIAAYLEECRQARREQSR